MAPGPRMVSLDVLKLMRVGAQSKEGRSELDSHADICAVGKNALILQVFEGREVSVTGYDHGKSKTFDLVCAAIGYTDPTSGRHRILIINQAVHIPHLENNLLCPF